MGNPVFCSAEFSSAKEKQFGQPSATANLRSRSRPTRWANATSEFPLLPNHPHNINHETEHPLRGHLNNRNANESSLSQTLEDIFPQRSFSLIINPQNASNIQERYAGERFGSVSEIRNNSNSTIEALGRLRRHLRMVASEDSYSSTVSSNETAEPRDRLDASRTTRRTRTERRQSREHDRELRRQNFLERDPERSTDFHNVRQLFQQWQVRSADRSTNNQIQVTRSNYNTQPSSIRDGIHSLAAREIYNQTALRLERTRELLAARQAQHLILSAHLEASTRAIGAHIENIREVLDIRHPLIDPANSINRNFSIATNEMVDMEDESSTIGMDDEELENIVIS